jgi:hypothetical protein
MATKPLPKTARNVLSNAERADRSRPTGSMRGLLVLRLERRPWRWTPALDGTASPKVAGRTRSSARHV